MATFLQLQGLSAYEDVHHLQQELVRRRAAHEIGDVILLLEHKPVITVGRKRDASSNVLLAGDTPVIEVERGGDVTWHGPGQLVAYPIVLLEGQRADLHLHLRSLEDAVMGLCSEIGLSPQRDARNTGVWLPDPNGGTPLKVCSVGIACRKWVSWHGLALNVAPDLSVFERIRPCGFTADIMTMVNAHCDLKWSVESLYHAMARQLAHTLEVDFDGQLVPVSSPDLETVLAMLGCGD